MFVFGLSLQEKGLIEKKYISKYFYVTIQKLDLIS